MNFKGLNNEPIYIEICISVQKQVVLIERVVLIMVGLYNRTLLYLLGKKTISGLTVKCLFMQGFCVYLMISFLIFF